MNLLNMIAKNPDIGNDIIQSGKRINWGEAIKRLAIENGIQDWDKIIVDAPNPSSVQGVGDPGGTTIPAETQQTVVPDETAGQGTEPTEEVPAY
jgi:hypothetical protein